MGVQRSVRLVNPSGLHARPAKLFATEAAATGATVRLTKGERTVNGASVLSVLTLGCHHGDEVVVEVEGADAEVHLEALVALIESGLGEPTA
ncbi:MAG: hypothetical protein RLZZ272_1001 [Actinomycetota bacterium]|jgi:phosphocarrier protein